MSFMSDMGVEVDKVEPQMWEESWICGSKWDKVVDLQCGFDEIGMEEQVEMIWEKCSQSVAYIKGTEHK